MKKKILVIMVFGIFMFNTLGSAIYMARAEQPNAANGGTLDFFASISISNDYCNDYITILSLVKSPSNTKPDEVRAEFNGVNITMKAPRITPDGNINGKNFIEGIKYYAFVKSPPTGTNNLTIHVGNASGWYSTTQGNYVYNKTFQLSSASLSLYNYWITPTKYLFVVSTSISDYSCIERVFVTINGTDYDMVRDITLLIGKYRYEHDFGPSDSYRSWICNATVIYQGGQNTSTNNIIEITAPAEISDVSANLVSSEYKEETKKIGLGIYYIDKKNRPPNDLIIEVNGVNTTLSKNLYYEKKFGQFAVEYKLGPMYCKNTGERLENHVLELNYTTLYNISIWYNNGTWVKKQIYTNYNTGPKPSLVNKPDFTVIHKAFAYNGTHATINVTFNITSDVPNFQLNDNSQVQANIRGIEFRTDIWIHESNPLDTNFSDGKTYTVNYTMWIGTKEYWGDLLVNITVKYGNDSFSTIAPFNRIYPTITIERTIGKPATFGIKGNEVLIYKNTEKVLKCCAQMYDYSTYRIQYNLTPVVRYLNSDLISFNYSWLEKKYNSTEYGINVDNEMMLFYNDEIEYEPYGSFMIVPLNHPARLAEYVNNLPVDDHPVQYKKDLFTGLMTISYKETSGDLTYERIFTWDKRGIIRFNIFKVYIGETLILERILELETTFMDLLFLDYLWYIIIGGGVVLIGIITAVIIKKKKM